MSNIYTIYLRQPSGKSDPRTDPLYNKGCFGSTGCHSKNVLKPEHEIMFRKGNDRLCFMQGGSKKTKIVYITPSISEVIKVKNILVIKWDSKWNEQNQRPLKYEYGLSLTNSLARKLNKKIPEAKPMEELYQHFRSRTEPVDNLDYLLAEYEKHINEMVKLHGSEIFVNDNHETFEFINKPEFYIYYTVSYCSSECGDKNCGRRENSSNKIRIKQKYICKPAKIKCRRCQPEMARG